MRTAFIVDSGDNPSLSRFTQAKLFFDANNQATDFVTDCEVVGSFDEAVEKSKHVLNSVVINNGTFLTSEFQAQHSRVHGLIDARDHRLTIKFDQHTYIGLSRRSHYQSGSKQLYIIENLLKTCLHNRELVYLDNTEELGDFPDNVYSHLIGLASGWKTIELAARLNFNVKSITVYDRNSTQLEHAKWLHSHAELPKQTRPYARTCGTYTPGVSTEVWQQWHQYPVQFKQIDLFDAPQFPDQSLIWISNVFCYESNIFDFGWKQCKNTHKQLLANNTGSIII